jgi:predicted ABC-type exoprotein transport system permease subunit
MLLESPHQVRSNRCYFTIFRATVWKILIFEWILLLEVQTNSKNWVWKEKSVELSMCSHCEILKFSN